MDRGTLITSELRIPIIMSNSTPNHVFDGEFLLKTKMRTGVQFFLQNFVTVYLYQSQYGLTR